MNNRGKKLFTIFAIAFFCISAGLTCVAYSTCALASTIDTIASHEHDSHIPITTTDSSDCVMMCIFHLTAITLNHENTESFIVSQASVYAGQYSDSQFYQSLFRPPATFFL